MKATKTTGSKGAKEHDKPVATAPEPSTAAPAAAAPLVPPPGYVTKTICIAHPTRANLRTTMPIFVPELYAGVIMGALKVLAVPAAVSMPPPAAAVMGGGGHAAKAADLISAAVPAPSLGNVAEPAVGLVPQPPINIFAPATTVGGAVYGVPAAPLGSAVAPPAIVGAGAEPLKPGAMAGGGTTTGAAEGVQVSITPPPVPAIPKAAHIEIMDSAANTAAAVRGATEQTATKDDLKPASHANAFKPVLPAVTVDAVVQMQVDPQPDLPHSATTTTRAPGKYKKLILQRQITA